MERKLPTNDIIRAVLGNDHPIPLGFNVILETYTVGDSFKTNDGSDSLFIRPDTAVERDKYQMACGRILMMGGAAFKGEKFKYWDVIPQVGDYVSYHKYQGTFKTTLNTETGCEVNTLDISDDLLFRIEPKPTLCSHHHFIGQ
jgi:hypothetical protein